MALKEGLEKKRQGETTGHEGSEKKQINLEWKWKQANYFWSFILDEHLYFWQNKPKYHVHLKDTKKTDLHTDQL